MKIIVFVAILLCPLWAISLNHIPDVIIHTKNKVHTKTKGVYGTVPGQTITQKQQQKLQPQTVGELLHKTTNVLLLSPDDIKTTVSIRGFGDNAAQNVLVLLNGQPLSNPDLGVNDINLLPIASIQQIQVLPNSYGVLYGDQAVGGVINIITKSPQKNYGTLNFSYGSFNAYDLGGEISNSYKNGFGYDANIGGFSSDHYRDHNTEHKNHGALNLTYHKNGTDAYLEYINVSQRLQLAGALTASQVAENRRQAKNNIDTSNSNEQMLLAGLSQKLWDYWRLKLDSSIFLDNGNGDLTENANSYKFTTDRNSYFIRPELIGMTDLWHWTVKPIVGFELKHADYTYKSSAYAAKDKQTQVAAFTQFSLYLTPKLIVIAGARAAHGNKSVYPLSLGLRYKINKHWLVYLRRDDNYRFPKVDEDTDTLNNQPLKPQTGVSYEMGINWHNKKLLLETQIFQLDLHDELAYIPLINTPYGFGYNENLDQTRRRGFNLNLNYNITKTWHLFGGYSLVIPKFISGQYKNNIIPDVPENSFNVGMDVNFAKHWDLFANSNYFGSSYPNNDVGNQHKINGYILLNAGIGFLYKKIRLTAKLNNLTNKKYNSATVMTYNADGSLNLLYYPAAGINGSINLVATL